MFKLFQYKTAIIDVKGNVTSDDHHGKVQTQNYEMSTSPGS